MRGQTISPLVRRQHRLDGGDVDGHKIAGVFRHCIEIVIADVYQRRLCGDRQQVQHRLGDHRQRALPAAERRIEIEPPILAHKMGEVVARHEAVELREYIRLILARSSEAMRASAR